MEHFSLEVESNLQRIGFHYHPEDEGYSISNARRWAKEIKGAGANWLLLINPSNRAIPEDFIRYLVKQDINLIVNFAKNMHEFEGLSEVEILVQVYAKWGVKYACLFEQPNMRSFWGVIKWMKEDIVKTHSQYFLDFAELCVGNGIRPVLSPLFPGGDYWDLAFLEYTLKYIQPKADSALLSNLVIAAYGWHHHHPLDWGTGGKEKWPNYSPFASSPETQNHQGFRLFEWYSEISKKIFSTRIPIIIFSAGEPGPDEEIDPRIKDDWALSCDQAMRLLSGENVYDLENPDRLLSPIGPDVIACCFSTTLGSDHQGSSTFTTPTSPSLEFKNNETSSPPFSEKMIKGSDDFPYRRYIFIDHPLQNKTPAILASLDRYIKMHKPYVGYSLVEGCKSAYLVVITDDKDTFSNEYRAILSDANIVKVLSLSELNTLNI